MIKEERWKTIPGFPNYEVSDAGNAKRVGKSKNLKQFGGRITVYRGKNNPIRLHIDEVVSFLFIGKKPDDHIIWHINGNCHDNRVENLKYVPKCYYDMESIEGEDWRDIPGYEGYYQVSNWGRVRCLERFVYRGKSHKGVDIYQRVDARILALHNTATGYHSVMLHKEGKTKRVLIHRIVALVFIPNTLFRPEINHKDGNRKNNLVWVNEDGTIDESKTNLEWCNRIENLLHASRVLHSMKYHGKPVRCVETNEVFPSIRCAAIHYGVSATNLGNSIRGKGQKRCAGYHWVYINNS